MDVRSLNRFCFMPAMRMSAHIVFESSPSGPNFSYPSRRKSTSSSAHGVLSFFCGAIPAPPPAPPGVDPPGVLPADLAALIVPPRALECRFATPSGFGIRGGPPRLFRGVPP
eukprot:31468-Pelagococcus_subviridis.AAC.9